MNKIINLKKTQTMLQERADSLENEARLIEKEIGLPTYDNVQFTIYDHSGFSIGVSDVTNVKNKELPHEQQFVKLFVIKDYGVHDETDFFKEQPYYNDLLQEVQDWAQRHLKDEDNVLPQIDGARADVEKMFNEEFGDDIHQKLQEG